MLGLILTELKKFVVHVGGEKAWKEIQAETGHEDQVYLATKLYLDTHVTRIAGAAATRMDRDLSEVLESFGTFLVPNLVDGFGHLLQPQWQTLDVVEHAEDTIHKVVRSQYSGASPARLQTERLGERELRLIYRSERKMCALAKGIVRGLAKHFGEDVRIYEETCQADGSDHCSLHLRVS